jgi:hypothetical protein
VGAKGIEEEEEEEEESLINGRHKKKICSTRNWPKTWMF